MFTYYGIDISKQELFRLFNIIDKDNSGCLDMEEFKAFASDPTANRIFKDLIYRMRKEHEKHFGQGRVNAYLPFCITRLFENLNFLCRRDAIFHDIDTNKI